MTVCIIWNQIVNSEQTIIICLVDDESTRHFMQPSDVQEINATNIAGIMNGCVSSDGRLTIKGAECIYCDINTTGCVILKIDGACYPGTIYCTFAD
jgi:hypothetical protein